MTRSLCRGWDDYLGCPWQEVQSVKNACYYPWHSRYHRQEEAACLGCEYVVGKTWGHMHGSIQRVSSRTCSDVRVVHTSCQDRYGAWSRMILQRKTCAGQEEQFLIRFPPGTGAQPCGSGTNPPQAQVPELLRISAWPSE